jgi:hypothetical protein
LSSAHLFLLHDTVHQTERLAPVEKARLRIEIVIPQIEDPTSGVVHVGSILRPDSIQKPKLQNPIYSSFEIVWIIFQHSRLHG